jgi:hypothetical protein
LPDTPRNTDCEQLQLPPEIQAVIIVPAPGLLVLFGGLLTVRTIKRRAYAANQWLCVITVM